MTDQDDLASKVSTLGLKDRSERATNEQVLDPRTRLVLFKLLNSGKIGELHGCVSTGKEANVYHAETPESLRGDDAFSGGMAVKVFKTSILVFKDRDRYVTGEFRFRRGYSRTNPRKMVQLWAEKEMRNLRRMHTAGIAVPTPVVRHNVLVMSFLGRDGWPAPRLKDAELGPAKWDELYVQCVKTMRTMFHTCRLVHADLSEFNMLYHAGRLWVIDVSQSVEHDHPHSLEFLRMDCTNVTDFFSKKGVATMSKFALFNFVADIRIDPAEVDARIQAARHSAPTPQDESQALEWKVAEAAFLQSFIPRTLFEVANAERDIFDPQRAPPVFYDTVTGLGSLDSVEGDDEDDSDEEGDDDEEEEEEETAPPTTTTTDGEPKKVVASMRKGEEDRTAKKERKKVVKEQNRERRKQKAERKKKRKVIEKVKSKQRASAQP